MARWHYTVRGVRDAINDDSLTFEETRDKVAAAIRASRWFKHFNEQSYSDLDGLVDELAEAEDVDTFDGVLAFVYDEADSTGAWIA